MAGHSHTHARARARACTHTHTQTHTHTAMSDEFDAMLASVPGGADEEEENDPASMEAFSDFLGGAEAEDEDEDEDDPAADVKAMQQALVNERVAHMDLLPHRCAALRSDTTGMYW